MNAPPEPPAHLPFTAGMLWAGGLVFLTAQWPRVVGLSMVVQSSQNKCFSKKGRSSMDFYNPVSEFPSVASVIHNGSKQIQVHPGSKRRDRDPTS